MPETDEVDLNDLRPLDVPNDLVPLPDGPTGPRPNPLEQWKLDHPNEGSAIYPSSQFGPASPDEVLHLPEVAGIPGAIVGKAVGAVRSLLTPTPDVSTGERGEVLKPYKPGAIEALQRAAPSIFGPEGEQREGAPIKGLVPMLDRLLLKPGEYGESGLVPFMFNPKPTVELPRFDINKDEGWETAGPKELANFMIGIPEFFTSGLGMTTIGAGGLYPTATRRIFALDIAKSLFEQAPELRDRWAQMTEAEKTKAAVDVVGQLGLLRQLTKSDTMPRVSSHVREIPSETSLMPPDARGNDKATFASREDLEKKRIETLRIGGIDFAFEPQADPEVIRITGNDLKPFVGAGAVAAARMPLTPTPDKESIEREISRAEILRPGEKPEPTQPDDFQRYQELERRALNGDMKAWAELEGAGQLPPEEPRTTPAPEVPQEPTVEPEEPTVQAEEEPPVIEAATPEEPAPATPPPVTEEQRRYREWLAKRLGDSKAQRLINKILGRPMNEGLPKPQPLFDEETATSGDDILAWMNGTNTRILTSSGARRKWGKAKFNENESLWEGQPELPNHHRNAIFSATSEMGPDQVATAAWRAGKLADGTERTLWEAIDLASKKRIAESSAQKREAYLAQKQGPQRLRWDRSTIEESESAPIPVTTEDLVRGDKVQVGGAELEVTGVDPDTLDLELTDGHTFGTQTLRDGETRWVEKVIKHPEGTNTDFLPPGVTPDEPKPPEPPKPPPEPTDIDLFNKAWELHDNGSHTEATAAISALQKLGDEKAEHLLNYKKTGHRSPPKGGVLPDVKAQLRVVQWSNGKWSYTHHWNNQWKHGGQFYKGQFDSRAEAIAEGIKNLRQDLRDWGRPYVERGRDKWVESAGAVKNNKLITDAIDRLEEAQRPEVGADEPYHIVKGVGMPGERNIWSVAQGAEFPAQGPRKYIQTGLTKVQAQKLLAKLQAEQTKTATTEPMALKEEPPKEEPPKIEAPPEPPPEEPPKIVGLGGAIPSEFEGNGTATGIKNADIDRQRKERGLDPIMSEVRQSIPEVFDRAMARIDQNPGWAEQITQELLQESRTLSAEEEIAMLQREAELRNAYAKTTRDLAEVYDAKQMELVPGLQQQAASWLTQLNEMDIALRRAGTHWGRSGRFRQLMMKEDYSLESMINQKRAARGGKPLSEAEHKQLEDLSKQIKESEERLRVVREAYAASQSAHEFELAHERMAKEEALAAVKKAGAYPEIIIRTAEKIVAQLDSRAAAARAELKAMRFFTGLDPTILTKLAVIGASHIGHVGLDFLKWSDRMLKDIGPKVEPFLKEVFTASQGYIDRIPEKGATPEKLKKIKEAVKDPEGRKPTTTPAPEKPKATTPVEPAPKPARKPRPAKSPGEVMDDQIEKIRGKVEKGIADEIWPEVNKLARALWQDGVRGREELVDALHSILSEMIPDITRREVMDAFSGYGRFTPISKEQIDVELRGHRGELQQIAKIEDLEAGVPLPMTGRERAKMTDAWRVLVKKVNEAKRKYGVVVTDPERQLKSALDARKTYYKNQITDLETQIRTREKFIKTRSPSPTDPELEALKKQRDELKQEFDRVFPKAPMSDMERLRLAIEGAKRNEVDWQKRLLDAKRGVYEKAKGKPPATGPELGAIRARVDAIKAEIEHLKAIDGFFQERVRGGAIEQAIKEYERRLAAGDFTKPVPAGKAASPRLQALLDRREALRKALAQARAGSPEAMAKALSKAEAYGAELQRRINEGEIAAKAKGPAGPTTPGLEAQRAENAELQKILTKLRNAAKPKISPEEIARKALKTRLRNRIAEYEERIANGDYARRPRQRHERDDETLRLEVEAARLKRSFRAGLVADRLANRKWWEKLMDQTVRYRRGFALSGITTLGKLLSAAVQRLVFSPAEEVVGAGWGKLFPGIADRAVSEGGFHPSIEVQAITKGFMKGVKEWKDVLRTGRGGLDVLYGKQRDISVGETTPTDQAWIDYFGHLHAVLKNPVKTAHFERAYEKRLDWYSRHGVEVIDDLMQIRIANEAYADAQRSIFLQDNRAVDVWRQILRTVEQSAKQTQAEREAGLQKGPPPVGYKILGTMMRLLVPIVRIPTNIVYETAQYAGGLPKALLYDVPKAMLRGVENLKPEEADLIMRNLKKGSLGLAALSLGYFAPNMFGGYYQPGKRREHGDVKAMSARIAGHNVPSWLLHNPLLETIQLGATIRRVADSRLRRSDPRVQGLSAGALAGAIGLVSEIPFVSEMMDLNKVLTPEERNQWFGELAKNLTDPVLVQQLAKWSDRRPHPPGVAGYLQSNPRERVTRTTMEHIKSGIPGARQTLPIDYRKESKQ